MPSPERPLTGRCACGAVRFQVTEPFQGAGYCHCHRCQQRSGVPWTMSGLVASGGVEILTGAEEISRWDPGDGGLTKCFCRRCGGHLFGGDPEVDPAVAVRFGALEGDPEIQPTWHAWVSSAPDWFPIPDDGLDRFPERRRAASDPDPPD